MIAYYEALIAQLEAEKEKYIQLKAALSGSLVPALQKPISSINSVITGIEQGYTLDGERADKGEILKELNGVTGMISTINTGVIPAIDMKIASINARIAQLRALIAQILAEEAAAAAAAASSGGGGGRSGSRGAR